MSKVRILIKLKNGIADPPGLTIEKDINNVFGLGVSNVHLGKLVEIELSESGSALDDTVKKLCDELLVNPVIEEYSYEII